MINVRWDEGALKRHEEWAFFILVEFGPQHVDSYLENIDHAVEVISWNPLIGTEVIHTLRINLRRFVTSQGYSVFYELDSLINPRRARIVSVVRGQG